MPSKRADALQAMLEPLPAVTLEELIAGGREQIDLLDVIQGKYNDDVLFAKVIENPRHFKNFELTKDGLMYMRSGDGNQVLCIPAAKSGNHTAHEIVISEAHSLLAHLGPRKTLTYLRELVWWKDMHHDVHIFCDLCIICKQSKPTNQKPYGLLNPLPVPTQP